MATYDSLSRTEKDQLQVFVHEVRVEVANIYNAAKSAGVLESTWNNDMSTLVASLDANEVIPNTTGLAGARGITKENFANNLMAYVITTASMGSDAHRDNIVPPAGAINVRR